MIDKTAPTNQGQFAGAFPVRSMAPSAFAAARTGIGTRDLLGRHRRRAMGEVSGPLPHREGLGDYIMDHRAGQTVLRFYHEPPVVPSEARDLDALDKISLRSE